MQDVQNYVEEITVKFIEIYIKYYLLI